MFTSILLFSVWYVSMFTNLAKVKIPSFFRIKLVSMFSRKVRLLFSFPHLFSTFIIFFVVFFFVGASFFFVRMDIAQLTAFKWRLILLCYV